MKVPEHPGSPQERLKLVQEIARLNTALAAKEKELEELKVSRHKAAAAGLEALSTSIDCNDRAEKAESELASVRAEAVRMRTAIRASVEKWLKPTESGGIEGYGGTMPGGDPFKHETWSDACDYQHAAIDIWESVQEALSSTPLSQHEARVAEAKDAVVEALTRTDILDWPKSRIESQDLTAQLRKRDWEKVQNALARLSELRKEAP